MTTEALEKRIANMLYNYLSDSELPDEMVPDCFLIPWAKQAAKELAPMLLVVDSTPPFESD